MAGLGDSMTAIAFALGGLIPTGIIAALFVWVMGLFTRLSAARKPVVRSAVANGASLVACMLVAVFGLGDRSLAAFGAVFVAYFPAQVVWFVVWFFVLKRRKGAAPRDR